jgi:YD repeat-containing protein
MVMGNVQSRARVPVRMPVPARMPVRSGCRGRARAVGRRGGDGWGNVASSAQEHDGEVVPPTTPAVQYDYDALARLCQVTYPNGRAVSYDYGAAGSMDFALGRVAAITDGGSATYADYDYLGAGTVVRVTHPEVADGLTLDYDPYGYHTYDGFDRFGRVVDQRWTNAAKTATLDEYAYTYDLAGNRTARTNALSATLSETYGYDGLSRLIDTDRGEGQQPDDFQSWELDAVF